MTEHHLEKKVGGLTISRSVKETEAAGARLAAVLEPGDCVCLIGPLGAGKTSFVRGAMRKLGVKRRAISPTFTLAHEGTGLPKERARSRGKHQGRSRAPVSVAHLDFYRLAGRAEERGLLDYLDGRFIVFVEWADLDRSYWPRNATTVRIDRLRGRARRILVRRAK